MRICSIGKEFLGATGLKKIPATVLQQFFLYMSLHISVKIADHLSSEF